MLISKIVIRIGFDFAGIHDTWVHQYVSPEHYGKNLEYRLSIYNDVII